MTRRARFLRLALVGAVVAVVGVLVMPGRLWVGQRNDIAQAEAQLAVLRDEHRDLSARVDRLSSARLIEQEAREGFARVYPGDEVYTIPPAPPLTVDLPDFWPFRELEQPLADAATEP